MSNDRVINIYNGLGCQLDEPYGFPDDHEQNAAMFQCHVNTGIYKIFYIPVPLLYSVGNKTYYYYIMCSFFVWSFQAQWIETYIGCIL